jgi:glucose-6-phosphate 1-dehydrogenase
MEVPAAFDADAIRDEKVKVLRSIAPIRPGDLVLGQYTAGEVEGEAAVGYTEEEGVPADSRTETYIALRLELDNWRWQGVPFYLRTGKRLERRLTQITVTFRRAPVFLFGVEYSRCEPQQNRLHITLQPDEGFALSFEVKEPGEPLEIETRPLRFLYEDVFGELPDAYQTLLLDVIGGNQMLFVRADEAEVAWQVFEPVLAALEDGPEVHPYPAGSWGPDDASRLLSAGNDCWAIFDFAGAMQKATQKNGRERRGDAPPE